MPNRPDLDKMTVQELTALIQEANAKRQQKMVEAKTALLSEFREKASQLGLTLESMINPSPSRQKPPKANGPSVAVKYRGPNGEEWSGRGRLPKWIQAAEAGGKNREEFRV